MAAFASPLGRRQWQKQSPERAPGHPRSRRFGVRRFFLEEELKAKADTLTSVDMRFGWKLTGFEDRGDHVTATIEKSGTAESHEITARYLVGCDGGNSLVRKSLGIELEGGSGVVRPMMGGPMYAAYFPCE